MNYEKIGKFISERRKELNMTQKMLADKLSLTDRAISKWERGRGCPDVSILEPLSQVLGVSVLEILHGEKIEDNENEVVVEILRKNAKRAKRWKIVSYVFLNCLLLILLYFSLGGFIVPKVLVSNDNIYLLKSFAGNNDNLYNEDDAIIFKKCKISNAEIGDIILFDYENVKYAYRVIDKKYENGKIFLGVNFRDFSRLKLTTADNLSETSDVDRYFYVDEEHFFGIEKGKSKIFSSKLFEDWNPYGDTDFQSDVFFICITIGAVAIIYLDFVELLRYKRNRKMRRVRG